MKPVQSFPSRRPVVLLMGPTGAGKTDVALDLAERFAAEIVSVDSAMVYRGLDIGTAKPERGARARIPHHLIDLLDPAESYSAGLFLRDATGAIDQIHARGHVPLLVGGTMLYFHALLNGLASLPAADAQVRRHLNATLADTGPDAMHAELARVDPVAAARIHPNDPQRIQRALEVFTLTGMPISALQRDRRYSLAGMKVARFVLCPPRPILHERIEARFHRMMQGGFLEEVRGLRARPDLGIDKPALRAVGYRQLWDHLTGACGLDEAMRRGIVATRRLAKRQLTWIRALPETEWLDPDNDAARERIGAWLASAECDGAC